MKDKEPLESITCAGCEHPIRDGDPVLVKAVGSEEADEADSGRNSWRSALGNSKAFALRAIEGYKGLEDIFKSLPRSVHDVCQKNTENIKDIAKGATALLPLAGKKGIILLRTVPLGGPVAGTAIAVVVVGVIMAGAIPVYNGRRSASRRKDSALPQYFHASCAECGDGLNCYESFAAGMSESGV